MSRKQPPKRYREMNARQLAKATAEFDRELVIDRSRELTDEEKARWQRARQKPGRPKVGKGAQVIPFRSKKACSPVPTGWPESSSCPEPN